MLRRRSVSAGFLNSHDSQAKHNGKFSVLVSLVKLPVSGALAMPPWLGKPGWSNRLFTDLDSRARAIHLLN